MHISSLTASSYNLHTHFLSNLGYHVSFNYPKRTIRSAVMFILNLSVSERRAIFTPRLIDFSAWFDRKM